MTLSGQDTIIHRRLAPSRGCYSLTNLGRWKAELAFRESYLGGTDRGSNKGPCGENGRDLSNCANHKKITQMYKSWYSWKSNPGPCGRKVETLPTVLTIRKSHKCTNLGIVRNRTQDPSEGRDLTNCANNTKITHMYKSWNSWGSNPGPCGWKEEILPTVLTIRKSHTCTNLGIAWDRTQDLVARRKRSYQLHNQAASTKDICNST